jgi:3-carboxy-cis,cis-muconate cycloisomerase
VTAFEALFVPDELREQLSGSAWLEAMLEVERALARAGARAGLVPPAAAEAIGRACHEAADHGWEALLHQAHDVGNPVEPLVRTIRARVGAEHERYVHYGATSQDVLDTAAMLIAGRALHRIDVDVRRLAACCAGLARDHRATPMVARTLLQQAVPTTFGLTAASWLVALLDARAGLLAWWEEHRAVQLGGAAGTLAAFGDEGQRVVELLAEELELATPTLPWHTNRVRVAELGAAVATLAGVCGKIGLDVALLAQTEVGEVSESAAGGSSTMPQKRNPVRSTLARASARLATGHASVLQGSLVQEHQRAAGAWHAEWEALCGVLGYGGGAAAAATEALEGLAVDGDRMRANLDASGALVLSERIAFRLADEIGRGAAHEVVAEAGASGRPFREALLADSRVPLSAEELDLLLDPTTYLGSAGVLTDRALQRYREELGGGE